MESSVDEEFYVPDISEFHIGFEFEEYDGQDWESSKITLWTDLKDLFDCEDKCPIPMRVKYLDKEDIESLGFELFDTTKKDEIYFRASDNLMTEQEIRLWVSKEFGYIEINDIKEKTGCEGLFRGKIKNKSELKKVLKSIGYE